MKQNREERTRNKSVRFEQHNNSSSCSQQVYDHTGGQNLNLISLEGMNRIEKCNQKYLQLKRIITEAELKLQDYYDHVRLKQKIGKIQKKNNQFISNVNDMFIEKQKQYSKIIQELKNRSFQPTQLNEQPQKISFFSNKIYQVSQQINKISISSQKRKQSLQLKLTKIQKAQKKQIKSLLKQKQSEQIQLRNKFDQIKMRIDQKMQKQKQRREEFDNRMIQMIGNITAKVQYKLKRG